jgi:hypothetical protein
MGYQDVAVKLRNGVTRHGTAFNAEFLLYSEESPQLLERISEPRQRSLMLERNEIGFGEEIRSLKVLQSDADVSPRIRESSSSTQRSSGGAGS